MFYSIFVRGDHLEYHVSQDREDCEQGRSMSRRINYVEHPNAVERCFNMWMEDALSYKCTLVPYLGGQS